MPKARGPEIVATVAWPVRVVADTEDVHTFTLETYYQKIGNN